MSLRTDDWFSVDYVTSSWVDVLEALWQHITITVLAVALATVVAIPVAMMVTRVRWLTTPTLIVAALLYTVPSLALITGLWPVFGLSSTTVVVALALYALLVILRNAIVGLQGVSPELVTAARGMGYSERQLLARVALPMATPAIMAGIRLATVSTVGLVMIGALVGHGGLGSIVLNGFQSNFYGTPILVGTILTIVLALSLEFLLTRAERWMTPWTQARP